MLLANNGVSGVSRILTEFVEEHSDNPTYLFERISETEDLVKWLWKTNHPDAIQILILGVIGKKSTEYLSKACQNIPLRLLPLMQLCWQYMKIKSGIKRLSN